MKIVEFLVLWSLEDMVQYEIRMGSDWVPVARYDTAHGFAHRDLLSAKGESVKTPIGIRDMRLALTFASSDLKANWRWYRQRYLEGHHED